MSAISTADWHIDVYKRQTLQEELIRIREKEKRTVLFVTHDINEAVYLACLLYTSFQELQRHRKIPFELVFLVMDPGYSEANRQVIENNAKLLNLPITVFESTIFEAVYEVEKSPCYLCARMRRGYLYSCLLYTSGGGVDNQDRNQMRASPAQ